MRVALLQMSTTEMLEKPRVDGDFDTTKKKATNFTEGYDE